MLRAVRLGAPAWRCWQTRCKFGSARWESTAATATSFANIAPLPPAPAPLPEDMLVVKTGELSLADMGIGGWSPSGMMQQCLEFLHVNFGIPWWGTIVIGTVCVRLILFPAIIITQRNNALMAIQSPRLQFLQGKIDYAKQCGDEFRAAQYSQMYAVHLRDNNISPFKNALVPLVQTPFFISFFFALRTMSGCPVESMMTGGLYWFTDLTVPDQYYALPFLTSMTMLITMEVGSDGNALALRTTTVKYLIRSIPFILLPFFINFPSAILCYWLTTNVMSLIQSGLLKVKPVRAYFDIPEIPVREFVGTDTKKKGIVETVKGSWKSIKSTREVQSVTRLDDSAFNKAGRGALVKTYKYDPTKVVAAKSGPTR